MRINKYLSSCELGSRRKVEEFIKSKEVMVNDSILTDLSYDVKDDDIVLDFFIGFFSDSVNLCYF